MTSVRVSRATDGIIEVQIKEELLGTNTNWLTLTEATILANLLLEEVRRG